jgi:hypothetical protein
MMNWNIPEHGISSVPEHELSKTKSAVTKVSLKLGPKPVSTASKGSNKRTRGTNVSASIFVLDLMIHELLWPAESDDETQDRTFRPQRTPPSTEDGSSDSDVITVGRDQFTKPSKSTGKAVRPVFLPL